MTWTHTSTTALHVLAMFPAMEIFLVCILPSGTCKVWFLLFHFMKFFHFFSIDLILQLLLLFWLWSLIILTSVTSVSWHILVFMLVHNESMLSACSCFQIYTHVTCFATLEYYILFMLPPCVFHEQFLQVWYISLLSYIWSLNFSFLKSHDCHLAVFFLYLPFMAEEWFT